MTKTLKPKITKILKGRFFCSLVMCFVTLSSQANVCKPGTVSYKKSHTIVLKDFAQNSGRIKLNGKSGRLSISSINEEIVETNFNGYKSRITLTASYGQISNEIGLLRSKVVYVLKTNSTCDDFEIESRTSDPAIDIGSPDSNLSSAAQTALKSYFENSDVIPENAHSGDYLIRIHTPEICSDGQSATVNIVRSNHQPSGIMYSTTSVLVDLQKTSALKIETRPGRLLRSYCQ
jgi:hypothetical protein